MIKIRLILPKNGVNLDLNNGEHLYFLAGPVRGAGDWQAKAIKMLTEKDPACYIVCPCRYDYKHELFRYRIPATELPRSTDNEKKLPEYALEFPNQTSWERHYLDIASHFGCVIFWLPCEDKENPRKKEDGPYARDSYGEIGRWSIRSAHKLNPYEVGKEVKLVIGAEKDFPGLSQIQTNLNGDHKTEFTIYTSLEETLNQAIKIANQ